MSKPSRSVAYMVRHVHQYRETFYTDLRSHLDSEGVRLDLLYGQPGIHDKAKNDAVFPEWALFRKNRIVGISGQELIYQPWFRDLLEYDLVIVEQASRLLVNYLLFARRALGRGPRLAMTGHGENLNSTPSAIGEALKRGYTGRLDWFFAYTEGSKARLVEMGLDSDRITVFENTLDMRTLVSQISGVSEADVALFKSRLGLGRENLVLCLGSLYHDKRPDLMIEIGDELNALRSDTDLLVVGSGELRESISEAASKRTWFAHLDAAFGHNKAVALAAADALLVPGVAGLVVLDAFAAGIPLVTADLPHHPPEVEYLEDDRNSVILSAGSNAKDFASELDELLRSGSYNKLCRGSLQSGKRLSIENMVQRFSDGVLQALSCP